MIKHPPTIAARILDWKFNSKQIQARKIIFNFSILDIIELLYGGAKGGGKSVGLCRFFYEYAHRIIDTYPEFFDNISAPVLLGFIGRVRGADFTRTTLETWKKFVDGPYKINSQVREIIIRNKVKYQFGGLDDEEGINKFNSAEFAIVGIDQAEEMERTDWSTLKATLRLKLGNHILPKRFIMTANPAQNFLKEEYVKPVTPNPNKIYLQALPSDNILLDPQYIETLKDAYKNFPELINAYINGSWEELSEGRVLIKPLFAEGAVNRHVVYQLPRRIVVCDPAWTGEDADEQVIYVVENGKVIEQAITTRHKTWELAGQIVSWMNEYDAFGIVDCIGIGAGVYDDCCKIISEERMIKFISSASAEETFDSSRAPHEFGNLRAQAWWNAQDMFADGQVSFPYDRELVKELTAVKYEIKHGRIYVEDKNLIKAKLGRSPDRADALVMGLWGATKAPVSMSALYPMDKDVCCTEYQTARRGY